MLQKTRVISRGHTKLPPTTQLSVFRFLVSTFLSKPWGNSSTPNAYSRCFQSSLETHVVLQYIVVFADPPVWDVLGIHRQTSGLFPRKNCANFFELLFHQFGHIRQLCQTHHHTPIDELLRYIFGAELDSTVRLHLLWVENTQLM